MSSRATSSPLSSCDPCEFEDLSDDAIDCEEEEEEANDGETDGKSNTNDAFFLEKANQAISLVKGFGELVSKSKQQLVEGKGSGQPQLQ